VCNLTPKIQGKFTIFLEYWLDITDSKNDFRSTAYQNYFLEIIHTETEFRVAIIKYTVASVYGVCICFVMMFVSHSQTTFFSLYIWAFPKCKREKAIWLYETKRKLYKC